MEIFDIFKNMSKLFFFVKFIIYFQYLLVYFFCIFLSSTVFCIMYHDIIPISCSSLYETNLHQRHFFFLLNNINYIPPLDILHVYSLFNCLIYLYILDDEITKLTTIIGQKSRDVISLGKQFFYKQIDESIKSAYK